MYDCYERFVKSLKPGPQKKHYQYILKDMMANDEWAMKIFKDVGVLLTSHPGNRPFLKASLETHKKLGFWTTVVYDNYFDPKNKEITYEQCMPYRDVFDLADTFLISHHQTWGGVLYPYFWCLYLGLHTMGSFKYVFCSNGDCVLEKPEGFPKIMEMLGDADIMGCGYEDNGGRHLFNTTSFIAKTSAIQAIMVHFRDHLIGIDTYEKLAERMGNTEGRFAIAIKDLGLKVKKVPVNPVNTQVALPGGTWYDILGFRHIHGEWNHAHRRKGIPPHPKYLDNRYMKGKVNLAKQYYDEKDEKKKQQILEKWWKAS
jgi:hypothetical protein